MQDTLDQEVEAFVSKITGLQEVKTTSACVSSMLKRAVAGHEKYGTTMDRDDLSFQDWLTHLIEELEDARQYAERLRSDKLGRFMLFAYSEYYPSGGAHDFVGWHSNLDDAVSAGKATGEVNWHVYDCELREIVAHC